MRENTWQCLPVTAYLPYRYIYYPKDAVLHNILSNFIWMSADTASGKSKRGVFMKHTKRDIIIGILFVLVTGTLSHFLYDWSGRLPVVGLFAPVNESVWEHMKLLFFPMLLYALFLCLKYKENLCHIVE